MLDDLRRSGLDADDARRMGLKYDAEFEVATGVVLRAYLIPYFDLRGALTGFSRARLLDPWTPKGEKRPRRYIQPPATQPALYFPPAPGIDWARIAKDTSITVTITEGEKKAYALSKIGVPCIGLGGVWSFLSKNGDGTSDPIEALGQIAWRS